MRDRKIEVKTSWTDENGNYDARTDWVDADTPGVMEQLQARLYELESLVASLTAENERLKSVVKFYHDKGNEAEDELDRLEAEVSRLSALVGEARARLERSDQEATEWGQDFFDLGRIPDVLSILSKADTP